MSNTLERPRLRHALTLAALLAAVAVTCTIRSGVAFAQFAPTVRTDRTAYAAGDDIAISGQGFAPRESVTFALTREDGTVDLSLGAPWTAAADDTGMVTTAGVMIADDSAGRRFVIHAAGPVSGESRSPVFVRSPMVATDSGVYVAGDTVAIGGRDFRAGETVTVRVVHADGTAEPGMGHQPVEATVRPDGTFAATWVPSNEDLAGPQLTVVAAGTVSGDIPTAGFLRVADIDTDKIDYYPGQTVIIAGRGFAPNELVKLQVVHADGRAEGGLGHEPFYATANAAGNLAASWFVNPDAYGFQFHVIAKGESSQVSGIATFWDAGPISLAALNVAYTQNFDTLLTTGTTNAWTDGGPPLDGWYSQFSLQPTNPTTYRADSGGSNTGAIYSWGVAGTNPLTERALGSIGSGTPGNIFNAARFVNNTGSTITSLDISFNGEQWRAGGCTPTPCTPAAQKLDFQYQVANAGVITDANTPSTEGAAGWIDYDALDFTTPTPGTSSATALDGNAAANRTALSSTLTLSVGPGQEVWLRWKDINDANNDHGLAIDDLSVTPRGPTGPPNLTINDVSLTEGNAGTTTFRFTVSLSAMAGAGGVTFDIATADGTAQDDNPAAEDNDYVAKSLTAQTIPAGSSSYTFDVLVNGDTVPEGNETFLVNVSNVTGANVLDAQGQGTIVNDDIALSYIHDVQGSGASSPLSGSTVKVEGVVVAAFQATTKLQGFFLEEEDADQDASVATSEGIFVFCGSCATAVAEGQRVSVTGAVSEFNGMTEITASSAGSVIVTDTGNHLGEVTASAIDLPIAGDVNAFYEAREGMKVTFVDALTVSEYFELGRYGQIVLFEGGRPQQFTEANAPSVAGYNTHVDNLSRREVILDDDNNTQQSYLATSSPAGPADGFQYVYHPRANGGLSVGTQGTDFFRGGDLVNGLTGVLHWSFPGFGDNTWRIRPTNAEPATFTVANPRPATPPAVGGAIKVVGMNLLNYFTTIDTTSSTSSGPCGPSGTQDCRGADSVNELNRQRARAAKVICTLNADIFGFAELENTTPADSITDLLGAVNALCGGTHPYTFVNTGGTLGTDAIRVQQIYRTGIVSPVGAPLSDMDPVHNRPPTAQTFDVVDATNPAAGERFTVVINHLKSKGCPGSGADADLGDGQGCFNGTRVAQATRLLTWINSTVLPAAGDPDVLLLGDFNSYAKEDPVTTLQVGGYVDLETAFHGASAYSYLFDGQLGHLDYAFANGSMQGQVTGADAWHINADENPLFDYNDEIRDVGEAQFDEKPDGSLLTPARNVFEPDSVYRASDHDPVVVGLFPIADLSIATSDAPDPVTVGESVTYTVTVTNNGPNDATGVTVIDMLPAGVAFVSASSGCVNSSGTVTCTVGALPNGGSAILTITVTAPATPGTISNSVSVTSNEGDSNSANNSATEATEVKRAPAADLSITKADSVDPVTVSESLTYTLQVTNSGPDDATGVTVTDTLPAGVAFVSASAGCVNSSGTVTCTVGPLANGATATLTITVTAPATPGSISNTASVTGSPADPIGANNSATETTLVKATVISRFVAFSRDLTWLRAGAIALTGDVGANERRISGHADAAPDDGGRNDVTVRVGAAASVQESVSRTVGDTVLLLPASSVNDVVYNFLLKKNGATVLGATTTPMAVPFTTLPAFPTVTPGTQNVTVAKNQTVTLAAGRYGDIRVSNGGTLVLTGGLYEINTLNLDPSATVMFRATTQLRIKTELGSKAKSRLILDPSVAGLKASQVTIYVAGRDAECSPSESDEDGDNGGPVTVHIGPQSVVQANIYAANGTVWLKSKTEATGAFIGVHVRVGTNARLTLDSAF